MDTPQYTGGFLDKSKPAGGLCDTMRSNMARSARWLVFLILLAPGGIGAARAESEAGSAAGAFLEGLQLAEDGRLEEAIDRMRFAASVDSSAVEIPRQLASFLLEADRPKEALAFAQRALSLDPADASSHWLEGRAWIQLENAERAVAAFRRAWEVEPNREDYLVSLLLALEAAGREQEALDLLEPERGGVEPDTPYLYFRRGTLRTRLGRPDPALDDFAAVLAFSSTYPGAVDRLIALSWRLGPSDRVASVLARACDQAPDRIEVRRELARVLLALGRREEAIPHLERMLAEDPNDPVIALQLGVIRFSQDRLAEALPLFRSARRLDPKLPECDLWLWRALNRADSLEGALGVADTMALMRPSDPEAHWYRGISLARLGRAEEGLAALDEADRLAPGHREANLLASVLLEEDGRVDEARERLLRALEGRQNDRDILFRLAGLEVRRERFEEALRWFRVLIAAHPDDAAALNEAGYLCADRGIYLEESLAWTSRAAALDAGNPAYLDSHAWSLYRSGRLEEALALLDRAVGLDPQEPEIGVHRAIVLRGLGREEEGLAALRGILASHPQDRRARELFQLWQGGKPDSTGNPESRPGVRAPGN